MSTIVVDASQSRASTAVERWYVVIVMCLVYAVSIADRYVCPRCSSRSAWI